MIRVYSNPDPAISHLVRNALEQIGVAAVVQGERPGAAMGEIPPVAAWSEVWVADHDRLDEVAVLISEVTTESVEQATWACGTCGETLDGQFGACWACGAVRPD